VQSLYQKAVYENAVAQNIIGYYIDTGTCGFDRNPQMAVEWYRRSAEQGTVTAQWNLALCYEYGKGVDKDLVKARLWYSQAELRGYTKVNQSTTRPPLDVGCANRRSCHFVAVEVAILTCSDGAEECASLGLAM